MRTPNLAALSLLAVGAACIHDPRPRQLAGGETITLESVELQLPAEPGWSVLQWAEREKRGVKLWRSSPAGTGGALASVVELNSTRADWTPEAFLAWARPKAPLEGDTVAFTPAPSEAVILDERFGPLSASGTFRIVPRSGAATPAGELFMRAFGPPGGNRIVVAHAKIAQEPGEPAPANAEPVLAGLRLRDPSAPGTGAASLPDVEGLGWGQVSAGAGAALRDGRWVPGAVLKGAVLGEAVYPRVRGGFGSGLAYTLFMGGDAEGSLVTQGLDWSMHAVRGPLRYGIGLDVGLVTRDPGEEDQKNYFAIGPRAFAGVDLLRTRTGAVVALEAEAAATTPGVVQGSLAAVVRFDAASLDSTPR